GGSASPGPPPHSPTVPDVSRRASRSGSSPSAGLPGRWASACTRAGPPVSEGCTRAITKVGEVIGPRTPRPAPIPWTRVVLPAPRSPLSTTRSPGSSTAASRLPSATMSSALATVSSSRIRGPASRRGAPGRGPPPRRSRRPGRVPARPDLGEHAGDRLVDQAGPLQDEPVAGAWHPDEVGAGDVHGQLDAEPRRYQPVLLGDD